MDRESAFELMCEHTQNQGLRRHMRCVEIAMRAYANANNEDVEKWGIVGLLHDFDYERFPTAPEHPLEGAKILAEKDTPKTSFMRSSRMWMKCRIVRVYRHWTRRCLLSMNCAGL